MHILLPFFAAAKPPAENPFHFFSPNYKYSCSQLSDLLAFTRRRKNSTRDELKPIYSARYAQNCFPGILPAPFSVYGLIIIALGIYALRSGRNVTIAWIVLIGGIVFYLLPIWKYYRDGRNAFVELNGQSS